MPKIKLTDGPAGSIWRRPPKGKTLEFYDTVCPGLTLRIGARKHGSYIVVFQVKGERQEGDPTQWRRKIGTTQTLTLEEARADAKVMIADAAKGIIPEQRQAEAAAADLAAKEAQQRLEADT